MESVRSWLADGRCQEGVDTCTLSGGGRQMESDMRGLTDGKCQGFGRCKVIRGGWQMESDRRGLADGKW